MTVQRIVLTIHMESRARTLSQELVALSLRIGIAVAFSVGAAFLVAIKAA